MKINFKIKEVKENIFLFEFENHYDMCMTFLRYQEFYESPNPKFRGKSFKILDFMKWYSEAFGNGAFTYPRDWDGFNIPGDIVEYAALLIPDDDYNDYDDAIKVAAAKCEKNSSTGYFYIIGALSGNDSAKEHEIAHALFYLYPEYKQQMTKLVKALPSLLREEISAKFKRLGYTTKVYIDETQAYMATGLNHLIEDPDEYINERKSFEDFFKEFSEKTK